MDDRDPFFPVQRTRRGCAATAPHQRKKPRNIRYRAPELTSCSRQWRLLAPMHLQVILNLFHAVDLAQRFLGHLLLIVGSDGPSQNDPSLASFKPQLFSGQMRAPFQRRASAINKLGVDHKPNLPIAGGRGRNMRSGSDRGTAIRRGTKRPLDIYTAISVKDVRFAVCAARLREPPRRGFRRCRS